MVSKFQMILNSIDWVFATVILIGGRYFGTKYFRLSKRDALNFLGFATAFGLIYLLIINYTVGSIKNQAANLFITYLIVTSFYELFAQKIFEVVEAFIMGLSGKKKEPTPLAEAVAKYEAVTGEKVEPKPIELTNEIKDLKETKDESTNSPNQ